MQVICDHAATCDTSGLCTHGTPHDRFPPWNMQEEEITCDHAHVCEYVRATVKCKEGEK